jgi:hypothetical protein
MHERITERGLAFGALLTGDPVEPLKKSRVQMTGERGVRVGGIEVTLFDEEVLTSDLGKPARKLTR